MYGNSVRITHDQLDEDKPEILHLSTIHLAKGLEFDQVIVSHGC